MKKINLDFIKENKKTLLISLASIALIICLVFVVKGLFFSHAATNTASFLKDQKVDGLLFTRTTFSDNTLKVIVKNTTDDAYNLKTIDVSFVDGDNKVITTVNGYVGDVIAKDSYKQLVVSSDIDLSKSSSLTYKINK